MSEKPIIAIPEGPFKPTWDSLKQYKVPRMVYGC